MVTAVDVVSWLGTAVFGAVAGLAVWRWRRDRTHATGAMAVAFVLLGLIRLADQAREALGEQVLTARLSALAFAGIGYAVLEHRAALFGLAARWRVAAAVTLLAASAVLQATADFGPDPAAPAGAAVGAGLVLLAGWTACMVEPARRLWRAARETATVQSAQLRLLASSYVGLAVVVVSGIVLAVPVDQHAGVRLGVEAATVAVALVLYASLHAPLALRRRWLRSQAQALVDRLHPVPRWYADLDTGTVWWSPALRALLGVGDGEAVSVERFLELVHEEDRDENAARLDEQLASHEAVTGTLRIRRAHDGEVRWVEATSGVLLDVEGRRAVGLYGTLTDVTAYKQVEERLQEALDAAHDATRELAAVSEQFQFESLHDPLTGLANRSLLVTQLDQAWVHHRRHGDGLVVLVLDLDGFKALNDRHGHEVGDELLVAVAERLLACVRSGDTVARLGGDEFVVVLPGADRTQACAVADRVLAELGAPLILGDEPYTVAASIGIAEVVARQPAPADLLREADAALYAAKAAGRGTYRLYVPGLDQTARLVLAGVEPAEARAWAAYVQDLRAEIADRKVAGDLPARTRAPEALHRTLMRLLGAIDGQLRDGQTTELRLVGGRDLEEFVFHHTAVQHWADALAARGELRVRRSPGADRFWEQLAHAVAGHEDTGVTAEEAVTGAHR